MGINSTIIKLKNKDTRFSFEGSSVFLNIVVVDVAPYQGSEDSSLLWRSHADGPDGWATATKCGLILMIYNFLDLGIAIEILSWGSGADITFEPKAR